MHIYEVLTIPLENPLHAYIYMGKSIEMGQKKRKEKKKNGQPRKEKVKPDNRVYSTQNEGGPLSCANDEILT